MPTMLIPIAGFRDHHHSSEIKPDDWNQWIALGGAAIGIAALAGQTDAQVDAIFAAAQALDNPTP
jgi:hypothetical protein